MIRSLFFAPANRHDLIIKFPRFAADCYAIDLEDGTPPDDKVEARGKLEKAVNTLRELGVQGLIYIRVNEPQSHHFIQDIQAAVACDIDGLILPKLERKEELFPMLHTILRKEAEQPGGRRIEIMGGIESMRGVVNAVKICSAHARMTSVYFGAEDFAADIGARRTKSGEEVLLARSQVVLAAKVARILPIDQAVVDIRDDEQCRQDAEKGRDLGYIGKICVLPRQVQICNTVFAPQPEEIEAAKELIAAYTQAVKNGYGTIDFRGKMIDGPLLKRAQATLTMAFQLDSKN